MEFATCRDEAAGGLHCGSAEAAVLVDLKFSIKPDQYGDETTLSWNATPSWMRPVWGQRCGAPRQGGLIPKLVRLDGELEIREHCSFGRSTVKSSCSFVPFMSQTPSSQKPTTTTLSHISSLSLSTASTPSPPPPTKPSSLFFNRHLLSSLHLLTLHLYPPTPVVHQRGLDATLVLLFLYQVQQHHPEAL